MEARPPRATPRGGGARSVGQAPSRTAPVFSDNNEHHPIPLWRLLWFLRRSLFMGYLLNEVKPQQLLVAYGVTTGPWLSNKNVHISSSYIRSWLQYISRFHWAFHAWLVPSRAVPLDSFWTICRRQFCRCLQRRRRWWSPASVRRAAAHLESANGCSVMSIDRHRLPLSAFPQLPCRRSCDDFPSPCVGRTTRSSGRCYTHCTSRSPCDRSSSTPMSDNQQNMILPATILPIWCPWR